MTKEEVLKPILKEEGCLWDEGYPHEYKAVNTSNTILEKAMDIWAEEMAVQFSHYCIEEEWYYVERRGKWFKADGRLLTTHDLYQVFINSLNKKEDETSTISD